MEAEVARYAAARETATEQLQALYEKAVKEVGEAGAEIFEAHQMRVEDGDFIDSAENIIRTQSVNAEAALHKSAYLCHSTAWCYLVLSCFLSLVFSLISFADALDTV